MPLKTPARKRPQTPTPSIRDRLIEGRKDSREKPAKETHKTPEKAGRARDSHRKDSSTSHETKKPTRAEPKTPKPAAGRKESAAYSQPLPPLFNISPERKLDLLGYGLVIFGLLLFLGLLSSNHSILLGTLLNGFKFLFGWGVYLLPLGLVIMGGWLALRQVEKIPPVSVERVTGFFLLVFFSFTLLHTFAEDPYAMNSEGGGWVGRLFFLFFYTGLGWYGTQVVLWAWFLIGLMFTLDLSIPEMVARMEPLWRLLRRWGWQIRQLVLRAPSAPHTPEADFAQPDLSTPQPIPAAVPAGGAQPVGSKVPVQPWTLPDVKEILNPGKAPIEDEAYIQQRARLIEETLASFGAPAQVVEINRGPSVTQFGVEPLFIETRGGKTRVRVSKIVSLSDDLAMALAAPRIRIQAPVPGRSYLGIEVPNEEMAVVALRDLVESEPFRRSRKTLSFALGQDVSGYPMAAELTNMPHMLIAGTTGSGKSVCVNAILTCILLYNTPDDVRLVLVDPKRVELTGYNGIPHLLAPVVVEMDKVVGALQWMTREMDRRYHNFAQVGARNIIDYNARMKAQNQPKLPYIVVIIDELADLMMLAPDETERTITRLAQLARATGIHLILATQRPSVDVVTGLIKANFPARIAFAVASNTDSRVILDQPGAERLLGRGDMLYQAPDSPAPSRLQGVFVSDGEIHRLVDFWRAQGSAGQVAMGSSGDGIPGVPLKQMPIWEQEAQEQGDPLYKEALDLIRREGRASVSMLQRKLRIGYTRASRLIDTLEEKKIIGEPEDSTGVRKVLDYGPAGPPKET